MAEDLDTSTAIGAGPDTGNPNEPSVGSDVAAAVDTAALPATSNVGTDNGNAEDTFFDPSELPPELMSGYKQMQRAFTKKTEGIAQGQRMIDAYKAFEADPDGSMQHLARQLGYTLTRAGEGSPNNAPQSDPLADWEPQSWKEVMEKAEERALARFKSEADPERTTMRTEIEGLRRTNIEQKLDDQYPEWREYESEMSTNMLKHPSLVNDPSALARLSIPEERLQAKAMQAALKRIEAKAASSQVSGGSTTRTEPSGKPKGNMTFRQAAQWAQAEVAAGRGVLPH